MKDSWFHPDRVGTYKGQMKNGLAHGKGKLIDFFQKTTKKGKFVKGSFKK